MSPSIDAGVGCALPHSYGSQCHLAPIVELVPSDGFDGIPPIRAQFFYSSPIPIDDPLFTTTAGTSEAKVPMRPFSVGDNNALERAWLSLASDRDRDTHRHALRSPSPSAALARASAERLAAIVDDLAARHWDKHVRDGQIQSSAAVLPFESDLLDTAACCSELQIDASAELRREFCALARRRQPVLDHDRVVRAVMERLNRLALAHMSEQQTTGGGSGRPKSASISYATSLGDTAIHPTSAHSLGSATARRSEPYAGGRDLTRAASVAGRRKPSLDTIMASGPTAPIPVRPPPVDDGISGKPFVRVDTDVSQSPTTASLPRSASDAAGPAHLLANERGRIRRDDRPILLSVDEGKKERRDSVEVPVGISRLHMVSLPVLQMKPIYWSPVNDMSIVMRATWFYKDSMMPIEPSVANQLESGYRELCPWTETWADELRSALDVGPLGEEKISHRLWPEHVNFTRRNTAKSESELEPAISSDPFCAARCFRGEAAAEGTLEPVHTETTPAAPGPEPRAFSNYHVIYKDASGAFLLKPSLQPSAYYGRKPVSRIMKGAAIGMPVVRGFDRNAWQKLHDEKATHGGFPRNALASNATNGDALGRPTAEGVAEGANCGACDQERRGGQVTDLCLVVHGIGQKFAERNESFHFTHAINAFRRAITVELHNPLVKSVLREGQNGIMVLPINWRQVLSFEDGGEMRDEDRASQAPDRFGLKDIEPNSIKAVRSLISDVMFDIPFYMSQHKPKMISALVREANRVYRLWCRNNPGFAETGRVHMIGHSLGSAMAIEVLSKQPSLVPRLNLDVETLEAMHFEFDLRNLFLLGSPAGFFLLLERGCLVPRRGRLKPGADPSDTVSNEIVSDAGAFGCLAVDNIYNILAKEDPIAYLLNGTVDPVYAASLRTAYVPSTVPSLFKSMGDAFKGAMGVAGPADASVPVLHRPSTGRLPSQLELEVHDFTREEMAEKKAFLLNDNGQIDWFLRSGGGPLEIQYLNMLSAHTSYWTNHDLIRMLCVEMGRKPGKGNTLPSMRVTKQTKRSPAGAR